MAKLAILGGLAAFALAGGAVLYFKNPAYSCSNPEVTSLAVNILGTQMKIPGNLSLTNIVQKSGGFFGNGYVCEAEIEGVEGDTTLFGTKLNRVRYTSQVTQDTHRVYVTAQLAAFAGD